MRVSASAQSLLAVAVLTACAAAPPPGPSVAVMPGQSKTFEQFQQDDTVCRQFALQGIGYASPAQTQQNATLAGAAVGTVAGAAAGAAIGAAGHNPGAGAAIGAGAGLVLGTAAGSSQGYASSAQAQRAYDVAYQQCMVAKGNGVAATGITQPISPAPYAYPYYAPPGWVWIDGGWGPPGPGPHPGHP